MRTPKRRLLAVLAVFVTLGSPAVAQKNEGGKTTPASVGTDRYGDPLPPDAAVRLGTVRFRHPTWLIGLAFSQDGKQIIGLGEASGKPDNQALSVWEAATGRRLQTIDIPRQSPRGLALWPEAQLAASVGFYYDEEQQTHRRSIKLVDLAAGAEEATIEWEEPRGVECSAVAWGPDGNVLISGSTDGTIRVWDRATATELLRYKTPAKRLEQIQVSPDGKLVAVASRSDKVYLWNWAEGGEPQGIEVGERGAISVAFSPDGKILAAGTDSDDGIHLIDVQQRQRLRRLVDPARDREHVPALQFSPDGKFLVTCGYFGNRLNVWEPGSGNLVRAIDIAPHRPGELAISPDSRLVASCGTEGVVRLWELASGKEVTAFLEAHLDENITIAVCDKPDVVVTGSHDGTVRRWNAETGKQQFQVQHDLPAGGFAWVRGLAMSPDGRWIATGGADNTTRLWEAETGRQVYKLPGHGEHGGRWQFAFSSDGKTFSTFGDDLRVRTWDVRTGKALEEYRINPQGVQLPKEEDLEEARFMMRGPHIGEGRFSPDATRFFLQIDNSLYLFDVATGKQLQKFDLERIQSIAATVGGKYVALNIRDKPIVVPGGGVRGAGSHTLVVLDTTTGKQVNRQEALKGYPGPVVFSADGKLIASATRGAPESVHIWDIDGGLRQTVGGYPGTVRDMEFSADGRRLIGGLSDKTVLIWELQVAK